MPAALRWARPADQALESGTLDLPPGLTRPTGGSGSLSLRSFSSLDLYGGASLGGDQVELLTLDAAAIRLRGAGDARVVARELRWVNTTGLALAADAGTGTGTGTGTGSVTLQASGGDLLLQGGALALQGAAQATLQAQRDLVFGQASDLRAGGGLALSAGRITAEDGATAAARAQGGSLAIQQQGSAGTRDAGVGASLTLSGNSLLQAGRVELPSGALTLQATGNGGVQFGGSSLTQLSGISRRFDGQAVSTSGGDLVVRADQGSVRQDSAAVIDVSAPLEGGRAGTVSLAAPAGSIDLRGGLLGRAATLADGASLMLDAAQPTPLGALARTLADGNQGADAAAGLAARGNFQHEVIVRNRQGDQVLPPDATLVAQRIGLASDSASLTVQGRLVADAPSGASRVLLAAGGDVTLAPGAVVSAVGTAPGGQGGTVQVLSRDGRIRLQEGTTLDLSGPRQQPAGGGWWIAAAARLAHRHLGSQPRRHRCGRRSHRCHGLWPVALRDRGRAGLQGRADPDRGHGGCDDARTCAYARTFTRTCADTFACACTGAGTCTSACTCARACTCAGSGSCDSFSR